MFCGKCGRGHCPIFAIIANEKKGNATFCRECGQKYPSPEPWHQHFNDDSPNKPSGPSRGKGNIFNSGANNPKGKGKGKGKGEGDKGAEVARLQKELAATKELLKKKEREVAASPADPEPEEEASEVEDLPAMAESIKHFKSLPPNFWPQQQEMLQKMEERYQELRDKKALAKPLPTRLSTVKKKLEKAEQRRDELEKHLVDIKEKYEKEQQESTQKLEQLKVDIKKLQEEQYSIGDAVKAGVNTSGEDHTLQDIMAKMQGAVPQAAQPAWQLAQEQIGEILRKSQQQVLQQQQEQQRQAEAAAAAAKDAAGGMEVEEDEVERLALQIRGPKPDYVNQDVWKEKVQETMQQIRNMRAQRDLPPPHRTYLPQQRQGRAGGQGEGAETPRCRNSVCSSRCRA